MIHLGFFIYYILSYVRRGLCSPLFFFLRRALCAVQSSCTVLFRCARPTHALHASSIINIIYGTYVGVCVTPFLFFLRRALCAVQSSCTVLFRCARPTHALHAPSDRVTVNSHTIHMCSSCRRVLRLFGTLL